MIQLFRLSRSLIVPAILSLGACATPTRYVDDSWRRLTEDETSALASPVLCYGASACAVAWRKAQAWVVEHSAWKIQVANDSLVQTYGPGSSVELGMAYTLLRKPLSQDVEELQLAASCGRDYGFRCFPIPTGERARAQFAIFMRQP